MAVDEALLRGRVPGSGPPTVRFYGWRPATVSLGYAQPLDETVDRARCRASWASALVRRPTGGSAILHEGPEREVTYSVVARGGDFPGADDVLETYRVIGQGLAAGLGRLGVAARAGAARPGATGDGRRPTSVSGGPGPTRSPSEAGSSSAALSAGSAEPFLQHGSVLLGADPARIRAVFPARADPTRG